MDDQAPTDLEMDLRRNLAVCTCKCVFMDHDGGCKKCRKCKAFRELIVFNSG